MVQAPSASVDLDPKEAGKDSTEKQDTSEIWVGHGASWFDVTASTVTIIIGSGVLHYPNAFAFLSWPGGVIYLTICLTGSLYSFWLLGNMHEMDGHRYITYRALGCRALGPLWGNLFVGFFQMVYLVGITIAHTVNAGQGLKAFYDIVCSKPCAPYGLSAWLVTFTGAQLIFMQAPNFHSYKSCVALAAFCSIGYCWIAVGGALNDGYSKYGGNPGKHNLNGFSLPNGIFNVIASLGAILFSSGSQNISMEVQAQLPSPSFPAMWKGTCIAFVIIAACQYPVAISGYWAYGNSAEDNIFSNISGPAWMKAFGYALIVIHMIGANQVAMMPVFDLIEEALHRRRIISGFPARLVVRSIITVAIGAIAVTLPFFGTILNFIGGVAACAVIFWIPPLIWVILRHGKERHPVFNLTLVVGWVIIGLLACVGALRDVIVQASHYHFFS